MDKAEDFYKFEGKNSYLFDESGGTYLLFFPISV